MASLQNSADIGIRVFLQDSASAALLTLDNYLKGIGNTANNSSASFMGLTAQLAGLAVVAGLSLTFAAFGGAMVYATQQGMDLYAAQVSIANATGMTMDAVQQLTPWLVNLGAGSIFSLQELAQGIAVVGQYGFKTTQDIEALSQEAVYLAEAAGTDTVSAFTLLAVTMQAFQLPASQAQYTASLLFYSIEHGTPNIYNLTSALGQLGGVAVTLHISLQDIIPALDTVTVGMGNSSSAAAGLRYFLVNIVHPTSAASAELRKLGLSAFNSQGQFIGLKPILQDISNTVAGLSDSAKADILGTLFNIRSGTAIKQLLGQIQEYENGVNNVNNTLTLHQQLMAAAAKVMSQLGSIIHEVTSNLQDFAAFIGLQLQTPLGGFLNQVNNVVIQLRQWAENPANAQLAAQFLALGAVISGVGLIIIGIVSSPIVAFLAVMVSVFAAVSGLALLLAQFRQHWQQLQPVIQTVWSVLQKVGFVLLTVGAAIAGVKITSMIAEFGQLVPGILTVIQLLGLYAARVAVSLGQNLLWGAKNIGFLIAYLWSEVPALLTSAGAWLANAAAATLAALPYILLGVLIAGMVVGLVVLLQHLGFLNVMMAAGKQALGLILPPLQQAGAAIKGAFLDALKQLHPVWQQMIQAFNQAKPFLMILGQILGGVIVLAIGVLIGLIRGLVIALSTIIVTVIHVAAGFIQAFAGVITFFSGFFKFLHGLFTWNGTEMLAGLKTMGAGILQIFTGLWNAVSSLFVGVFKAIIGFVSGFIQGVIQFFQHLFDKLIGHSIFTDLLFGMLKLVLNIGPEIANGFGNLVTMVINVVKTLPQKIKDALGDLGSLLVNAGKALIQGFINGIGSMFNGLKNGIGNLLGGVRNLFPHSPAKEGPLMDAHLWMPNLVHQLSDTAEAAGPSLKASMSRVAGSAKAGLGGPTGAGGGGANGGATYTFVMDGKAVMSFFHNQLTGQLQSNGAGRLLR